MQAIILNKTGAAQNLAVKDIAEPKKFTKNDVLIKQSAIGVNFFDICFRRGQYKLDKMPAVLGNEGVGVVEAVGSNVREFRVGERVAYGTGPIGAYVEKRVIDKKYLVPVPDDISDAQAVAVLTKGMMAHSLLFRAFIAKRAKVILVHAAAGGVGQFLCQWGKALGVEVIGVVGSQEKVQFGLENGCKSVIDAKKGDFLDEVMKITKGKGVGAVYDGVGKGSLERSLQCLWPMGICLSYGEAAGACAKLDLNYMVQNSLYLTRPTLAMYKANRVELVLAAEEIFGLVKKGVLRPKITEMGFAEVAKAHDLLESRRSVGSVVLKV